MRDEHIISILESAPFTSLDERELARVRAHMGNCPTCRRAYEAAQISSLLLRERVAESFEPSPFFQTRVLAALRERQAEREATGFRRLWKTTGALVSSMAATVAALAVLTFLAPASQPEPETQAMASVTSLYSAEAVVFAADNQAGDEMTYEQVLTTLYESEENGVR